MTLIFGINLCDRIYLSGDIRMTQKRGSNILEKKDQIVKIVYLTPLIIGAFAADARMSVYIAKKLKKTLKQDYDIRSFYENAEKILAPIANEYWENFNPASSVTIIFGGLNTTEKKKFDFEDVYKKIKEYTELSKSKPSMNLKPALFNVLMKNGNEPLGYPEPIDTLVFSIQIFPPNGIVKEKAEWGEYLAYGPKGLNKKDIDPLVFGMVEFNEGKESKDNVSISAVLSSIAEDRKEETISREFFHAFISDQAQGAITGCIYRIKKETMKSEYMQNIVNRGQTFYSVDEKGTFRKLTFLEDYENFGDLNIL